MKPRRTSGEVHEWPEACEIPDPTPRHPEEVCARRAVTRIGGVPVCAEHRADPKARLPRQVRT